MNIRLITSVLVLFSAFTSFLNGAEANYYFNNINVRNGLSQNSANAIIQDKKGFMWIGTKDGLDRYDGTRIRAFRHLHSNPESLRNNFVKALLEDPDGNIWVGTDCGIDIYLPETDRFQHLEFEDDNVKDVGYSVSTIAKDSNDDIWIAFEDRGILKIDKNRENAEFHSCTDHPEFSLVTSIMFDRNGIIWLGCYGKGLYWSSDNLKTTNQYSDPNSGEMPFINEYISSIIPSLFNNLFVGSLKGGVWELDPSTGELKEILMKDEQGNVIRCRTLLLKSGRQLLAGTESGLFIHNLATGSTKHLRSSFYDPYSLSANSVYSMCEDSEGGLWIGTYFGGVDHYSPSYSYFEKYYPNNEEKNLRGKRVREICQDNDGFIWIGTEDGGLHKFDPRTKTFSFIQSSQNFNNIHGLCLVDDNLWVGTISRGIRVIDTHTGKIIKSYENTESNKVLIDNNVFSICRTSKREIFIGTQFGLMLYHPDTDSFESIPELDGKHIYDIKEDFRGDIWIATYTSGAWKYTRHNNSWHQYRFNKNDPRSISSDMVLSIFIDSKHNVCLTTQGGGCCIYHEEDNSFTSLTTENGLPDDVIFQIVEDRARNIWMTTNRGLVNVTFNPSENIKIYTAEDGLLCDQFNYKSSFISPDGTIYLGSIQGLMTFNPDNMYKIMQRPDLVITDFLLLGQEVKSGETGSPLEKSIEYTDKITLKYSQNTFSLIMAAPSYSSTPTITYMLDGFDQSWLTSRENRTASYSNLKYGHYTFRAFLLGSNNEVINESECMIKIHIRPPFYLSWIAIVTYIMIVITIISLFLNNVKKRNQARYDMQLSMIEKEKERIIYDSKIEFFTNIAHEIRTPLTLINGPLECVLAQDNLDNDTKEELGVMKQNTERLIDLTNQLLDFRNTEQQKYKLGFTECNVSELISSISSRFKTMARQNSMIFDVIMPDESVYAHINKEAFTKIISNMINNGLKYADSYLKITLSVDKDADVFNVKTENDGQIVPDDMREAIFKPFVRFVNEKTSATSGTGLGLGLSRSLASLHNGSLRMIPGDKENVFLLTMPLKQETIMQISKINGPEIKDDEPEECTKDKRPTVLVVEDDQALTSFIVKQLSKSFNVLQAENGKKALSIMDKTNVNIVVSDIMMPEMDGMELCRTIKSNIRYSHIPVILLTAKTNIQSKIEGLELGADSYIEKPFSVRYLLASISCLLEGREKLRNLFANSPLADSDVMTLSKADEDFLKSLDKVIEENYSNSDFSMDDMAVDLNMSRSSFYRKMNGVLDMSPNDYLRLVRLKKAASLLQQGNVRVSEACYLVGFNSPSYFAKCFCKQFGISPKDFAEKSISAKS